jgi:hypothetical protein
VNNALHTIALTQVRMHGSRGRVYYDRKIAEGNTHAPSTATRARLLHARVTDVGMARTVSV